MQTLFNTLTVFSILYVIAVFLIFLNSQHKKIPDSTRLFLIISFLASLSFLLVNGFSFAAMVFAFLLTNVWSIIAVLGGLFLAGGLIFLIVKFR